jgi:hypothetical protein
VEHIVPAEVKPREVTMHPRGEHEDGPQDGKDILRDA